MEMGDADRIIEAFQGLERSLDRLHSVDRSHRQEIHINAGGVGVWIATTCCVVMISLGLIGAILYVNQSRKVDQMQDYLNAIYMQAPYLKPKDHGT